MLSGLDGLEISKCLQRNPQTAAIPILMLTAKGEEVDRIVGFELGAADYVTKPFRAESPYGKTATAMLFTLPAAPLTSKKTERPL